MSQTSSNAISSDIDIAQIQLPVTTADINVKKSNEERLRGVELTNQTNLLPFKQVVIVLLGLTSCTIVSSLDSVIVATVLPTISAAFDAGSIVSWVPAATLLTSTGFQPLYGRFSDIFGRKLTLCTAIGLFMIGNLAAGLSRSINELIVSRGLSGVGAGGMMTMVQIIMSDVVSLRDRGKYQGIIGGGLAFGYAVGPPIGGVLAEKVSWRWCFWITVPISVMAAAIVAFVLPLKPVVGGIKHKLMVVDYAGSVLALSGSVFILLGLTWGGVTFPWTSAYVLSALIGGMFVMFLFGLWEWKGARLPIVPLHIFRHSTVNGVYIVAFINGFIFYTSLFYISQFFQVALGYSPIRSGTTIFPLLIAQTTASFISGIAVSRTGKYRTIIYSGFTIWSIACGCLSTLDPTRPKAVQVILLLLAGAGAGQTLQTTTVAAQASVSRSDMSVVTAVRNFVRFTGGALSLAVGSSIINNGLVSKGHSLALATDLITQITDQPTFIVREELNITSYEREALLAGYISGYRTIFLLNASLAALAVFTAVTMIHHKELTRENDAKGKEEARERNEMKTLNFKTRGGCEG